MPFWLIAAYVFLWAVGAVSSLAYRRRIRRQYPGLAARLFPGLMDKSIRSDLAGMRFMLRGEYRQLDDPAFVRLSELFRGLVVAFLAVFVTTMVVFLLTL